MVRNQRNVTSNRVIHNLQKYNLDETSLILMEMKNMCAQHVLDITGFCVSCNREICDECMKDSKHTFHWIKTIAEINEKVPVGEILKSLEKALSLNEKGIKVSGIIF